MHSIAYSLTQMFSMTHSVSVNASICAVGGATHDKSSYLLCFPLPFGAIEVLAADFLLTYQMSSETFSIASGVAETREN